jgi:nucleoside recognition membrane protein YjiH
MSHLRRWGVTYFLLAFFIASLIGYFFAELAVVAKDAQAHGQAFTWSDFQAQFWSGVLENLQSEWAQLWVQAVFVVGFADKIFKKSQEETDQIKAELRKLHEEVKRQGGL